LKQVIAEDGTSMKLKDAMAKPAGTSFHTHTIQVQGYLHHKKQRLPRTLQ